MAKIFTGMTRQPEKLGMPLSFWLAGTSLPILLYILTNSYGFWALLTVIPSWIAMRFAAKKEPYLFKVLYARFYITPKTATSFYFGGNSYAG